jgi:hypothetical protein
LVVLRRREALLTGRVEQLSVSLVSQLEMGEFSRVRLSNTGDWTHRYTPFRVGSNMFVIGMLGILLTPDKFLKCRWRNAHKVKNTIII